MKTLIIIVLAITVVGCTKSVEKPEVDKDEIHRIVNSKKIS